MKMKKLTSILLAGIMITGSVPLTASTVFAAGDKSDFEYIITASGDAMINDYVGKNKKEIEIPGSIDGHNVSAIGSYSFSYNKEIEKVTIPKSVKSIGNNAFYNCESLRAVSIPESVTSIRYGAFSECPYLYDVTLPSKISSIESYLFSGTAITKMDIPETVKSIGSGAFENCEKLESISIPDSVALMSDSVFYGCKALSSVKLSKNIKEIGASTFEGDTQLSSISIPSKVKTIDRLAFAETGIKSVSISKNVKTIADKVFYNCFNLKKFSVNSKNLYYSSKKGVLYNKKNTKLLVYPAGRTNKSFTVNKKITKIANSAFYGAQKLNNVTFKKGVKTIKAHAFENCGIKKVKLPVTVKTIGEKAFNNNQNLTNVNIPESVKNIGSYAFAENKALKTIKFKGNSKLELGWGVFEACKTLRTISMPIAKSSRGGLCFACTKLNAVKISKNVKKIYDEDFAECRKLNKITVPKTVKKIGRYALGYVNYYDGDYDRNDNLVIKGAKNSAAQKYAKNNGFVFKKTK